jgi:hypothetical protein
MEWTETDREELASLFTEALQPFVNRPITPEVKEEVCITLAKVRWAWMVGKMCPICNGLE